jgi:hypothetical protein
MGRPTITADSWVSITPNQVSTELGNETVILGVEAGRYFGLNEVGARLWALMQQPTSVSALWEQLAAEYEVGREELQRDVLELLAELEQQGLIHVQAAPDGA